MLLVVISGLRSTSPAPVETVSAVVVVMAGPFAEAMLVAARVLCPLAQQRNHQCSSATTAGRLTPLPPSSRLPEPRRVGSARIPFGRAAAAQSLPAPQRYDARRGDNVSNWTTILVGVDGSQSSRTALAWAAQEA